MTPQERIKGCTTLRTAVRVAITHTDKMKSLEHLATLTRDAMEFNINPILLFVSDQVFNDRVKEGSV